MSIYALTITKDQALARQIEDHLRRLIKRGEFRPEQKLPTVRQMARLWDTNVASVHQALNRLTKEGLLVAVPRKGVFVRRPEERLTAVGIYYPSDLSSPHAIGYEQYVHVMQAVLKQQFSKRGVKTLVWHDPRAERDQAQPWPMLVESVRRREIQGLIGVDCIAGQIEWLDQLNIPTVYHIDVRIPYTVDFDHRQFVEASLRCLVAQGCRRVGLISPVAPGRAEAHGPRRIVEDFFVHFSDLASDLGLETRNEWMRVSDFEQVGDHLQENLGYRQFHELWQLAERPDGLVVHTDTTARGVVTAILERRVDVPRELKLVLHKNAEVPLLCPLPATFLVTSATAVAEALIAQLQRRLAGQPCEPIILPYQVQESPRPSSPA